jgi:ketosteroid isomerase-like protein
VTRTEDYEHRAQPIDEHERRVQATTPPPAKSSKPITRMPVHFPKHIRPNRKLDERLWARFPGLMHFSAALITRLPENWRLRRLMVVYWVKRSYEIVNRRDFELALAAQDPAIVISWAQNPSGRVPGDLVGDFHGYEGFRQVWDAWLEPFDDLRLEPEEVVDLGGVRLLVTMRAIGHGSGSGIEAAERGYTLFTFRRGKVLRQELFFDRAQAEQAAGLVAR